MKQIFDFLTSSETIGRKDAAIKRPWMGSSSVSGGVSGGIRKANMDIEL